MTEDEARKLWCPFARAIDHHGDVRDGVAGINRDDDGHPDEACRCLASGCMAWRWYGGPDDAQTNGWCGLAGGP